MRAAAKAKSGGSGGGAAAKGFGAAKAPAPGKDTCACGSKIVYRECCEPYHAGAAVPPDVEAALRARFCGFVKGRVPYLLSTFHPHYHAFKYGTEAGGAAKQLERDLETAVSRFKYSGFKVGAALYGSGLWAGASYGRRRCCAAAGGWGIATRYGATGALYI